MNLSSAFQCVIFFTCLGLTLAREPACSKFDFEEKLLEKVVRMEFELEQLKKINADLTELNATTRRLADDVALVKDAAKTPLILFRARSPTTMTPQDADTIIYQVVDANHGGGYDQRTGVFTAPVSGLYLFTVNLCRDKVDYFDISVKKGSEVIAGIRAVDYRYNQCSSVTASVFVKINETVFVYVSNTATMLDEYPNYFNLFSGFLVHV